MLTSNGQHICYPLISLLSTALAYAGQGLLDAQAPKVKRPKAIATTANLFMVINFLKPNMSNS